MYQDQINLWRWLSLPVEEEFCLQIKKEYVFEDTGKETFPKVKVELNLPPLEHKNSD